MKREVAAETTQAKKQPSSQRNYTAPGKLMQYSSLPVSEQTASILLIDGFAVSQTDYAGRISTQSRTYMATGIRLSQTDSRLNTTTTQTDCAGRPILVTDPEGRISTTAYDSRFDSPTCETNVSGKTTCMSYDIRGRKISEWGTAVQPVCFSYNEADQMISLRTFRAEEADITTDPCERTDGDTTTWIYDEATGLELQKTFANGTSITRTYDYFNRLETLTKARGLVTTYTYAPLTGEPLTVTHNDQTVGWSYAYNHLGQITAFTDASGTRQISYNEYGQAADEESLLATHEIQLREFYDEYGRPAGYRLMMDSRILLNTALAYNTEGRLASMQESDCEPFAWSYDTQSGFLSTLAYPNGITRQNNYESRRNLMDQILYTSPGETNPATGHEYEYDDLARPTLRKDTWGTPAPTSTRLFTYNDRSELIRDRIQNTDNYFDYIYDNIGNRKENTELAVVTNYQTNQLNQYESIATEETTFVPEFDADGNQTLIKTTTGIWTVLYDANDRPVKFTRADGNMEVHCGYDSKGRRYEKKVITNGVTTYHARYLYRGYLQITEINLLTSPPSPVYSYVWDPTQTTATRILQRKHWSADGTEVQENLYYLHDALKNVTALFNTARERKARYEYKPFGGLLASDGEKVEDNKFRFSCEYMDDELGLIYYNYRHLNVVEGKWLTRELLAESETHNLYLFVKNSPVIGIDRIGTYTIDPNNINCIGHATGVDGDLQPGESSLEEMFKDLGWKCSDTKGECKCDCANESVIMVFIYIKKRTPMSSSYLDDIQDEYKSTKNKCWDEPKFWQTAEAEPLDAHGIKRNCSEKDGSTKSWEYVGQQTQKGSPDSEIQYIDNPNNYFPKKQIILQKCCKKPRKKTS